MKLFNYNIKESIISEQLKDINQSFTVLNKASFAM